MAKTTKKKSVKKPATEKAATKKSTTRKAETPTEQVEVVEAPPDIKTPKKVARAKERDPRLPEPGTTIQKRNRAGEVVAEVTVLEDGGFLFNSPGRHQSIVTREEWESAQAILRGNRPRYVKHGPEDFWLKGLWTCPMCGKPMTAALVKHRYRRYVCHRCPPPRRWLAEEWADDALADELRKMRVPPADAKEAFDGLSRPDAAAQAREAQARALRQREADLARKLDGLIDMRAAQEIDANTFARKKADIDRDLAGVREQLTATKGSGPVRVDTLAKVFELLENLADLYVAAEPAQKRRILDLVFLNFQGDGVSLCPKKRRPFDLLAERPLVLFGRGERI